MDGRNVSIALSGGGTAGHVNPLLAVASRIRELEPDVRITVIGTAVGLEARLVPAAGFDLFTIQKVPFPRRPNLDALKFPVRWVRETNQVRAMMTDRNVDVLVGFGGYASAPAYRAARKLDVPIVIHEQNARAGMANKLGAGWARFIGTAYEGTGLRPGKGTVIERVGLPLRPAIARLCDQLRDDRAQVRAACAADLGVDPDRPMILVTGGSLGALSLNKAVSGAAAQLLEVAQVVHLTGRGKADQVRASVAASAGADALAGLDHDGGDYHVAEYLERIDKAFACADLVLCRSGAGTVSEISALGLPAVYVPLPIGNGEQRFNAQPVVTAGGGLMVADRDFTADWVRGHVPALVGDAGRLEAMAHAAWGYGIRDAADRMAHEVLALAGRPA